MVFELGWGPKSIGAAARNGVQKSPVGSICFELRCVGRSCAVTFLLTKDALTEFYASVSLLFWAPSPETIFLYQKQVEFTVLDFPPQEFCTIDKT